MTRDLTRDRLQPTALDDVSKAIIEQLQQDGRRSYASIGKVVGLSEAAAAMTSSTEDRIAAC